MFNSIYLYDQLKHRTITLDYSCSLNALTESCYDIIEADKAVHETMNMIEESSKNGKLNLIQKFKTYISSADKILSQYKEKALKCRPIGLQFKDFKTFVSESEVKSLHKKALAYLNKFDPSKASEEQLKTYIKDSQHNVQYNEISKIFGNGKERFNIKDIVVTSTKDKELTKNDISQAVKFLETFSNSLTKLQKEQNQNDAEYTAYVRQTGLATVKTNGDIKSLRKNAQNHKRALIAIADSTYYQMMYFAIQQEFNQNKRIVVKAANYNPRNLKESFVVQDYIDAMYDFHENY